MTTDQNFQSAQEVHKQKPASGPADSPKQAVSRFSPSYWAGRVFRPFYTRGGQRFEVAELNIQVKHAGVRRTVPLASNNVSEAARRAAQFYTELQRNGWDAALRMFRPDETTKTETPTVGQYLELIEQFAPLNPRTALNYAYALRKIAAGIAGSKLKKGRNRFHPGGHWREAANEIPLDVLTPVAVEDWATAFVRAHKGDALAEQRAARSVNSFLRNARANFSRRILEAMKKRGVQLPDPVPFAGVRLERDTGNTRYRSTFDAGELLNDAKAELAESDPDAYAAVLLASGAGLRCGEIDRLQWQHVDRARGIVRVATISQGRVKTSDSEADVQVDPGLFAELPRRNGSTLFVVEPDREKPAGKDVKAYRAKHTFDRANRWLRAHGVSANKPLHELRKEFGSVVAAAGDIHQASRQLRHSQISTTAAYYADARKRATMPIRALLGAEKKGLG